MINSTPIMLNSNLVTSMIKSLRFLVLALAFLGFSVSASAAQISATDLTVIGYSSEQSAHPASNIVDGTTSDYWTGSATAYPQWVIIRVGDGSTDYAIDELIYMQYSSSRYYQYIITSSLTGDATDLTGTITTLVDNSSNTSTSSSITHTLGSAVTLRYIKFELTGSGGYWPRVDELEVYGAIVVGCTAASISTHPSAASVSEGASTTMSVATAGTTPTYQWQYSATSGGTYSNVSNGTPANVTYADATTNTLTITAGAGSSGTTGFYKCIASVACDASSATSNAAELTITAGCAAPIGAPTGTPVFSALSQPSKTSVTWGSVTKAASADNVIIFAAYDGAAFNGDAANATTTTLPIDGTVYTASTDWSSRGTAINATTAKWYCVYNGSAATASVSMTNLSNSVYYIFRAFSYNSCSSSPKYYTTNFVSDTIMNSAPTVTTQAVGSITQTTATANGTVSKTYANITTSGLCWSTSSSPTISDSKTTNGPTTAKVATAYTGAMTGLIAGTTYYVRAYATNGINTSYGAEVSFTTDATACFDIKPTTQPTVSTFSSVGDASMTLGLTKATTGTKTLILCKKGSAVDGTLVDNTLYTASTNFGSGTQIGSGNYVVYYGDDASPSLTVTGLSASTTYHFAAYAVQECSAGPTYNYFTTSPLTASQATTAVPLGRTVVIEKGGVSTDGDATDGVTVSTSGTGSNSATISCVDASSYSYISMNGSSSKWTYTLSDLTERIDSINIVWKSLENAAEVPIAFGTSISGATPLTITKGGLATTSVLNNGSNNCENGETIIFPINEPVQAVWLARNMLAVSGTALNTYNASLQLRIDASETGWDDYYGSGSSIIIARLTFYISTIQTTAPVIAIADNGTQVAASNISPSSTKNVLSTFTLTNTGDASGILNSLSFTTTGTAIASDIDFFKLYYNTSNDLSTATLLSSTAGAAAGTHTFTGLTKSIAMSGGVGYFWITVGVSSAPEAHTIACSAIGGTALTFATTTVTGSTTAGGTKTIILSPTITTASDDLSFTSCLASTKTKSLLIKGYALESNLTLTLAGADKDSYSLSLETVPFATANASGQSINITYTAASGAVGPTAATLTIDDAGTADPLVINLIGTTVGSCYTLTTAVSSTSAGIINISPVLSSYPEGTSVTLIAAPLTGYQFDSWTGDVASETSSTATITMDGDKSVTAIFTQSPPTSVYHECWIDGFEDVEENPNTVGTDNFLDISSVTALKTLVIGTGTWVMSDISLEQEAANVHGGANAIELTGSDGYITTPTLINTRKVSFYLKPKAVNDGTATEGIKVKWNGVVFTTGVSVDGVAATANSSDRYIFTTDDWHLVEVTLPNSDEHAFSIVSGGTTADESDFYIDDVSFECNAMLVSANDASNLDYVLAAGPSTEKVIAISGSDLVSWSGTVAFSDLGNFEISLDNKATWVTGTGQSFSFSSNSFVKLIYARLKSGLSLGNYSKEISLTVSGYTNETPTFTLSGSVVTEITNPSCDVEVVVSKLVGKVFGNLPDISRASRDALLSTFMVDAITGGAWTWTDRAYPLVRDSILGYTGNLFDYTGDAIFYAGLAELNTAGEGAIYSPLITFGENEPYQLEFSFCNQKDDRSIPLGVSYSVNGGISWTLIKNFPTTNVEDYFITETVDLSTLPITGGVMFKFENNDTDAEIILQNIITRGKTQRQFFNDANPLLEGFESYVNCPSDPQSFVLTGECLDDDGTLFFNSVYYEFSATEDGSYGSTVSYTGIYPAIGKTFYVRQKGGTSAIANVYEEVKISGAGVSTGSALSQFMTGSIVSPSISAFVEGQKFNFVTPYGVSTRKSIEFNSGDLCDNIVVESTCAQVAPCEEGVYGTSATIPADSEDKYIFLEYTPGVGLNNCIVTLSSGGDTINILIDWIGYTTGTAVVIADKSIVPNVSIVGVPVAVTVTPAVGASSVITITSNAGSSTGFEFSIENIVYGAFTPITETTAEMLSSLYIRKKPGTASGTTETITLSTPGATSAVFTVIAE